MFTDETPRGMRRFRRFAVFPSTAYFSQKILGVMMWCAGSFLKVFLEHVRAVTTDPVLLLIVNHSSHNRLIDPL